MNKNINFWWLIIKMCFLSLFSALASFSVDFVVAVMFCREGEVVNEGVLREAPSSSLNAEEYQPCVIPVRSQDRNVVRGISRDIRRQEEEKTISIKHKLNFGFDLCVRTKEMFLGRRIRWVIADVWRGRTFIHLFSCPNYFSLLFFLRFRSITHPPTWISAPAGMARGMNFNGSPWKKHGRVKKFITEECLTWKTNVNVLLQSDILKSLSIFFHCFWQCYWYPSCF